MGPRISPALGGRRRNEAGLSVEGFDATAHMDQRTLAWAQKKKDQINYIFGAIYLGARGT